MTIETLYASGDYSGSVAGSANVVGAPNGTWTTTTGATSWTAAWAMQNPAGAVGTGTHTITVRARKEAAQTGTPSMVVNLLQGATVIATVVASTNVTSGTGQDVSGTFAASLITDLTDVNVQVVTTAAGGSPSVRTAVQIDSITWSGDFAATTPVTNTVPASWHVRTVALRQVAASWHVSLGVQKTAATSWNVRTSVQKAAVTSWNVRVSIAAPALRATSWNVTGTALLTVPVSWHTFISIGAPREYPVSWITQDYFSSMTITTSIWTGVDEIPATVTVWNGVREVPISNPETI